MKVVEAINLWTLVPKNEMLTALNLEARMAYGELPITDIIRVCVREDGTIDLLDFSLPSRTGRERNGLPQEEVPRWIMETISMLRIAKENDLVPELGFKVSDTVYYVLDKTGDEHVE